MKKIGILFGQERSFPMAFIERVNSKGVEGIMAEPVRIEKVVQGEPTGYAVIIDRISQDVPFYRAYLKNAAMAGAAVINNPFWWSADDKFFNNCLMTQVGVPVPKTVILPSFDLPADTKSESFSNLAYPLDWDSIFNYIGFPAYMKPYAGGGWKNVYRLGSKEEFYEKHGETGQLVMLLQEEIVFDEYYRCYCIGGKYVRIMPYEPRNPHHERYRASFSPSQERLQQMEEIVLKINHALGYDFNTVELAMRDGVPYAIDFGNPAPDAERTSVGDENFEWVVETAANYAIERALAQQDGQDNLTWGDFVKRGAAASSSSDATAPDKKKRRLNPKAEASTPSGNGTEASTAAESLEQNTTDETERVQTPVASSTSEEGSTTKRRAATKAKSKQKKTLSESKSRIESVYRYAG